MPTVSHRQGTLFDPKPFARAPSVTERGLQDDWIEHHGDRIAYHGTFRSDYQHATTAHMGTLNAAAGRLSDVPKLNKTSMASYYDASTPEDGYEDDDYDEDDPDHNLHTGHVHARRMHDVARLNVADRNANAGDMLHWMRRGAEEWEVPKSVRESASGVDPLPDGPDHIVTRGMTRAGIKTARMLGKGKSVSYRNDVEDPGSTSYIVPRGGSMSWDEDVLNDPHTSTMKREFAMRRVNQGQAGAVTFPEHPGVKRYVHQARLAVDNDTNDLRQTAVEQPQEWHPPNISRIQFRTEQ